MIARTVLFCFLLISGIAGSAQKQLDRGEFYAAMESNQIAVIEDQQQLAKSSGNPGFEGALLMKKADLVSKAGEKLSLFKTGHKMLDEAINNDAANAELRFLRLMVQEHAPGILNYKGNIESDSGIIKKNFNQLNAEAKKAVLRYSKTSKVLKPTDFDGS